MHALGARELRRAVAALVRRLPPPAPGSQVAFAFDHDRAAFVVALLAVWQRGHAVALPASARRRHLGPVMLQADTVALVHDTGAGLGIDVARLLREPAADDVPPHDVHLAGTLRVFAADGGVRQVAAAELDTQIARTIADLSLHAGARVANLSALHSAAALVPGLLAPLAAGAVVTDEPEGAAVVVAAAGHLPGGQAARTVTIVDPPDVPPTPPPYRPLHFAAVPPTSGEAARFRTTVPRDFFGFVGHFPGYPVLSGAVQLHELVLPCLAAAGGTVRITAFQDLKFLARIAPGDTIDVVLRHHDARSTCEFEVVRGTARCSAGRVLLGAADAEAL